MNKEIAISILEPELERFFRKPWADLKPLIEKEPYTDEIKGKDDIGYQIEIQCFWDDKPDQDIRIIGAVDDGGIRAHFPATRDRLKRAEPGEVVNASQPAGLPENHLHD